MREAENPRPPQKGEQHTHTQKTKQKQKQKNKTKQNKKENKQTNKHDSYRRWRLAEECSFFRLPKRRAATVVTPVIRAYKGNLRLLIIISEN